MNLIYGALMLHEAGKEINESNMKKLVDSVGIKVDETQIKALVTALEGVDIEEAVSKSVVVQQATPEVKAEKEGEKKEEKSEEEAAEGLSSLFG